MMTYRIGYACCWLLIVQGASRVDAPCMLFGCAGLVVIGSLHIAALVRG